jgi:hypothetical protein
MNIQEAKGHEIRRKDHVLPEDRTEGKDDVADFIEREIVEAGRWPMDMQDVAEEVGYSRQHVTNTIRDYFEVDGAPVEIAVDGNRAHIEFDVPPTDDPDAYVRGYLRGWLDARES